MKKEELIETECGRNGDSVRIEGGTAVPFTALASEPALAEDWLASGEDEAWAYLAQAEARRPPISGGETSS